MITSFFTTKTNKRKPIETQADCEPQEKKSKKRNYLVGYTPQTTPGLIKNMKKHLLAGGNTHYRNISHIDNKRLVI